jgi:hypothetical protein
VSVRRCNGSLDYADEQVERAARAKRKGALALPGRHDFQGHVRKGLRRTETSKQDVADFGCNPAAPQFGWYGMLNVILDCEMGDLIEPVTAARLAGKTRAAAAEAGVGALRPRRARIASVSPPECAGGGKHLRSLQRRGQDWFCGACGPVRVPCAGRGQDRVVTTFDRHGRLRCSQCPGSDDCDPLAILTEVISGLEPSLPTGAVTAAASRVFARPAKLRQPQAEADQPGLSGRQVGRPLPRHQYPDPVGADTLPARHRPPAAVLARMLGIHISVATAWQRAQAGDWATYAADVSRGLDTLTQSNARTGPGNTSDTKEGPPSNQSARNITHGSSRSSHTPRSRMRPPAAGR